MTTKSDKTPITVVRGDGIGPEITDATLRILETAGAQLDPEFIEAGLEVYKRGVSTGISDEMWTSLRRTKVLLKGPITTPSGGGVKSLNVTLRKTLGLYANVRPVTAYAPFVDTKHPNMDLVCVRENEEDLYAGIEHRQTSEVTQCLKLISRPGSERIIRYAFEYAKCQGRKKVACFSKPNIMKITDGLFQQVFEEIGAEYPDIEKSTHIIDIATARLADDPSQFEIIVTQNLYGDIISDVAAQISGSVGLAGSANYGQDVAMFEAIHGSAPDIAGKGIANPSGILRAAILMMGYIGQSEVATKVSNAWLKTIEDGIHTGDVYNEAHSTRRVNTREFADAVCERIGQMPEKLKAQVYRPMTWKPKPFVPAPRPKKECLGVDIYVDWDGPERNPNTLAALVKESENDALPLKIITCRGVKVWPNPHESTFRADHWRCRFRLPENQLVSPKEVTGLISRLVDAGVDVIKTDNLYTFDGEIGFSLGQGE